MIGTTCGIIFIVLSVLAVFHTRKLRLQRAQSRRSEVASTVSFDVHHANAPPSYETGITGIFRLSYYCSAEAHDVFAGNFRGITLKIVNILCRETESSHL